MSDFNVTAPRLPGTVGAVSPAAITGTVPDPPRSIAGLDNGTILRGTVQGRDKDGLVTIKTDQGILKVATTANLPAGSNVTLEVRAIGDRLQIMVLSVDAPGPLPLPQSPSPQPQPQLPQGQPQAPGTQPPVSSGGTTAGPATDTDAGGKTNAPAPVEAPTPRPVVVVVGSTLSAIVVQALPRDLLQLVATAQQQPRRGTDSITLPTAPMAGPAPGAPNGASGTPSTMPPGGTLGGGTLGESFGGTSLIPQIRDKIEMLFFGSPTAQAALSAEGAAESLGATPGPLGGAPLTGSPLTSSGSGIGTGIATGLSTGATAGAAVGSLSGELLVDQTLTTPLATGTEVKLRVLALQSQLGEILDFPGLNQSEAGQSGLTQPGLPQPGLAALAGNGKNALLGQIIGQTPAGHPVIHTPVGDLVLHERISLPTGAKILLAMDQMETILPAVAPVLTPQTAAVNLARGWPTLADLLLTLLPGGSDDGTPTAATQAANRDIAAALAALPQPGNRLTAGLLSAMDAFRSGDFEKLFGPLNQALKTVGGRGDALRKMRDEFQQLSSLAQDGKGQDWRSFFLPLWDDGQLQQINLFYRRPRRDQSRDDDKDGTGTRFIVEVNFTRLGACQLDGLVKKKRFDLMVRSHQSLPESSRREIGNLFAQARELGDYAGDIHFQTTARFPVSPLVEVAENPPSVVA